MDNLQIEESENVEEKIRAIFSTNYILKNFNESIKENYIKIFKIPVIEKLFSNSELMSSIKQFLENDLVISKTSRNSFMHRNTLIYRFKKLKKMIGLDLQRFNDAVIFNNIINIKKCLDEKNLVI
ncbi:MAG: helix-turn-helix domain-containing protein [Clostridia bacterium]|jgi:carbohydrate diacid regulator|nr:helix-turn-helix domain-containing protein [Clostridia bacterium]MDD3862509.1 helix-turn-helix domain-containing protein [Clostridia bacterium]MDD4408811.1 helix-turn-helix domain-containing protein [Clostridia bacterium]